MRSGDITKGLFQSDLVPQSFDGQDCAEHDGLVDLQILAKRRIWLSVPEIIRDGFEKRPIFAYRLKP